MKKLLVLLVLVFTLSAFAFTFTACDKPEHVHDYKTVKYDNVNHWLECDCGEDKGKEAHVLNNNVCKCGYEKVQGHIHVFDKEIVKDSFKKCDATCTEKAKYYVSCECGEKGDETFEVGFALEHNYGVWVSNGDGTHTKTCINDNSHKVTNDCSGGTATEEKRPVCSVCKGEYGSVLNHTHSFTAQIITDKFLLTKATCTNSAVYYYSCKCGEKGTETFTVGEVLGHTYVEEVTAPTCTEQGYTTYTCSGCGDSYVDNYVDALGHNYENGVCSLCGEKKVSEGLKFTLINNDTEYEVSGIGTCKDTDIIIPDTYNGKPVTSIGDYAFYDCDSLQSVVIGNSVTSIGDFAFYLCTSLQSIEVAEENTNYKDIDGNLYTKDGKTLIQYAIGKTATTFTIPDGVEIIGNYAFYYCDSLQSVVIPDSVTSIGDRAFYRCTSLQSVVIGNGVTSIGNYAFYSCDSLQSVEIPDSVTSIGDYAFSWCSSLQSVVIGNSVTSIGNYAFSDCYSLQSVVIGNSVTSIGDYVFSDCPSLESVEVAEENTNYKDIDGNLYTKDGKTLIQYAIGKTATTFTIPNGVEIIGNSAFSYCDSLQSVVIPDSVTSIGDVAFFYCGSLGNIYCEAESQPAGWSSNWLVFCNATVTWGYKG